ncbi:restriction endonuclease subunit S [Chryseobacterium aahli]|uniref:restriction endonuclease subunit S n=1 Tax=Chryseobacterium aahli TaxID=1278643 RepID=UPI001F600020|nr:restriction endonuclease subunit S [Chryseobacterium aahli]MCI3938256.1 restriction endonuclease subunit S [Chryseobacterium aahli]
MTEKNKSIRNFPNLRFPGFAVEWEVNKLGDICKMQAGKFVSASEILKETDNKLYPCYGANGLRGFTYSYNYEGEYSLIGRQGALCGNVTRVFDKFYATEHAVVVTPKYKVHSTWLFYLLKYLNLNQYATGMAQPGLSVQNLLEVESIITDSLEEQEKIAFLLSLIDDRISTQKKILKELKSLIKSSREKIFSQKLKFRTVNEIDFSNWEIKKIRDLFEIKKGEQLNKDDLNDAGSYPCLNGGISFSGFTEKFNSEENTITISEGGNSCGYINFMSTKFWLGGHCYKIIVNKNASKKYFYHLLKYNESKIMNLRVGSGLPNIQLKDLKNLNLLVSNDFEEQTQIANFLSSIDEKIETEKKILAQYETQKKYLLANLFI